MSNEPLKVELTRAGIVESVHLVDAVVVDTAGQVQETWGDFARHTLPRSATKPLQALPLVETGAADAFNLSTVELSMSCASHNGEASHVATVEAWLAKVGSGQEDLACASHPHSEPRLIADDYCSGLPTPVSNNCSGKHSGFITLMRHEGVEVDGYLAPEHPLHRDYITPMLAEMCHFDPAGQEPGIDGCGVPVWAIPLTGLATGWANLPGRPAGRRLLDAMIAEPFYMAGTGRSCTRINTEGQGRAIVKTGAEGVFCGTLPDQGLGIALKVHDGGARASGAAAAWLLHQLGALDFDGTDEVTNHAGRVVGEIRVRA
ncbi:MAG: asparaginase [Acidimicrobiales bacterium]|jgi:L-asparaginase II|nr:asparaginase [Acidimicrobiales bacterium]